MVLFGVHGQVGSRLMHSLTQAGYEVTGIDRLACDFASATAKEIAVILRAVEPQLVINAAAYTQVDKAESEAELAQRINADVPEMIAAAAEEQSIPFVHFSTDYVFDGLRGAPYDENAEPHPVNAYAHSKRAGEVGVLKHGGTVFRLQWVYAGRGKNFFLTMKKLLTEREEVRVVADQIGAPTHAQHIADTIVRAAPRLTAGTLPPGIYHLTAAGHTSWHGFACAIAQATHSNARVVAIVTAEYPLPAARPKDARLCGEKLAGQGIAMPHWREGIALAVRESNETL
jgi:dTDP-4-dehydrorhamnose reductase